MASLKNSPKIKLRIVLFLGGVTLILSNSCALAHTDVTPEQARNLIDSTNDLVVVDVREEYEYCDAIGHIPGALNYPLSSGVLEARYGELPLDDSILVVCRGGGRSNRAANFLDSKGFSMVYDMMGGMMAWLWETEPCKQDDDNGTGSTETNTYVFLPEKSTLLQTGGIAGINRIFSVEGYFHLTVDKDADTGSFTLVDAIAIDDSPFKHTLDPNQVFNMNSLSGKVIDETTISFTGNASDGSDIHITATFQEDLVRLVGQTIPPANSADFFIYNLDAAAQRKYNGGTGEPNDPYQIATVEDLILLGEAPEDYDKHFILTADIDLDPNIPGLKVFDKAVIAADTNDIDPFFQGTPFTGVFDGNGKKIYNFNCISKVTNYIGLFGYVGAWGKEAIIKGLGLINPNVDVGIGDYIGSLVGELNNGTITDCYAESGNVLGRNNVGGLVGAYGGILLVFPEPPFTISNCYSTSSVKGTNNVGGLVGLNSVGTITNSYATGEVSGRESIGGLVGQNGKIGNDFTFSIPGTILNCYSTGFVSGWSNLGGLIGLHNAGIINGCFWDIETSGMTTSDGGIGKRAADMQMASTFLEAGWDFVDETENGTEDIWWILEGQDYPRLFWELMPEN
jgi:rhodanese-related sulfurtransferase